MERQAVAPPLDEAPLLEPLLDWMQRGDIGRRDGDGPVRVGRDEYPGCILYGPFWRLWPGAYRLAIEIEAGAPNTRAQIVFGVDVPCVAIRAERYLRCLSI